MSLLSDARFFLKKHIKNPVIRGAIAYMIYRLITRHTNKETLVESMRVVQDTKDYTIIYDDSIQKYILLDNQKLDVFSSSEESEIKQFAKKKFGGN